MPIPSSNPVANSNKSVIKPNAPYLKWPINSAIISSILDHQPKHSTPFHSVHNVRECQSSSITQPNRDTTCSLREPLRYWYKVANTTSTRAQQSPRSPPVIENNSKQQSPSSHSNHSETSCFAINRSPNNKPKSKIHMSYRNWNRI